MPSQAKKQSSNTTTTNKNNTPNLPKNWPPHLKFLTSPSYSPTLTAEHRASLGGIRPQQQQQGEEDTAGNGNYDNNYVYSNNKNNAIQILPRNSPKGPCPAVKITAITDPAHPTCGQAGLFAARDLKPGSFIIEYLGVIHYSAPPISTPSHPPSSHTPSSPSHSSPSSNYDLSLDRALHIGIDAALAGNEARFINGYRGVGVGSDGGGRGCGRARPNAEFRELWSEARRERGVGVWVLPVGKGKGKGKGKRGRKGRLWA